jgi:predicted ATP-dependent serine protease
MAVDFKTFSSIVDHVTAVRKPVLLRGRHGIGKSTVVYQYANSIGMPVMVTAPNLIHQTGSRPHATTQLSFSWMKSTELHLRFAKAYSS